MITTTLCKASGDNVTPARINITNEFPPNGWIGDRAYADRDRDFFLSEALTLRRAMRSLPQGTVDHLFVILANERVSGLHIPAEPPRKSIVRVKYRDEEAGDAALMCGERELATGDYDDLAGMSDVINEAVNRW